jgi:protein-S-isoprenylcysteine O-methyltransferase Ste14
VDFPSASRINGWLWLAWLIYWYAAAIFVKSTKQSESIAQRLQHIIPLWIGAILIFNDPSHPFLIGRLYNNDSIRYLGTVLTVIGLLFSVWARIHLGQNWSGMVTLKEGHKLIRTGPYAITRNPIYTGLLLAAVGTAISKTTGDAFIGVLFFLIAFLIKIRREQKFMAAEFGEEFQQFMREVPSLVPFVY